MALQNNAKIPNWLDKDEYPFEHRFCELKGGRMHYVDEGKGQTLLFVHGNPDWSFAYRKLIKILSKKFRCVAVDHLGFGLSDKPQKGEWLPKNHGENLREFIEKLDLADLTLVANDWGGAFIMPYATTCSENVKNIVFINTSPIPADPSNFTVRAFSKILGGSIGRTLNVRLNFFINVVLKSLLTKKENKTPKLMANYRGPMTTSADRLASASLPKQILNSIPWQKNYWNDKANLAKINKFIIWGLKDPIFPPNMLAEMKKEFPEAGVTELADEGHYPHDEAAPEVAQAIIKFVL